MAIIRKAIITKIINGLVKQKSAYRGSVGHSGSKLAALVKDISFVMLAVFAITVYAILGIYEIFFNSPLEEWISGAWSLILNASPQSIVNMPSQITYEESLMRRTVGEWLGFVSPLLIDIVYIILAPLASIFGIIIVLIAVAVRLGMHMLGFFSFLASRKSSLRSISWIILALSTLPLLVKYF